MALGPREITWPKFSRSFSSGTSYVDFGTAAFLTSGASFSVFTWARRLVAGEAGAVVGKRDGYSLGGNQFCFNTGGPGGNEHTFDLTTNAAGAVFSSLRSPLGRWFPAGAVGTTGASFGFCDGKIQTTSSTVTVGTGTTQRLSIGRLVAENTYDWPGDIALVAVWEAALSQGEARALMDGVDPWTIQPHTMKLLWMPERARGPDIDKVLGRIGQVVGTTIASAPPPKQRKQPPQLGTISSTTNGVGAADGTGAATGTGAAIFSGVGAADGTGAAAGVGTSTAASDGASAGLGDAAGVGASTAEGVGAADGLGAAAGIADSPAVGAADGTGAAAGVGTGVGSGSGTADGLGDALGIGVAIFSGTGVSAGTGEPLAVGASTFAGVGLAAGVGTALGITPTFWTTRRLVTVMTDQRSLISLPDTRMLEIPINRQNEA